MAVLYVKEATEQFKRRARHRQSQKQYRGHEAVQMASERAESGQYELLVKDQLPIPLARGYIKGGQELLKNEEAEKTIAEYVQKYDLNRFALNKAIEQNRLPSRK